MLTATLICNVAFSQGELIYNQTVIGKEFFNPAYNTLKEHASINLIRHEQWKSGVDESPETFATNISVPLNSSGLGIGLNVISESLGLRDNTLVSAFLSHRVSVSEESFLALGYGGGILKQSYSKQKMILSSPSDNIDHIDINDDLFMVSVGAFYKSPVSYMGFSANSLLTNLKSGSKLLPGFDFSVGLDFYAREKIKVNPDFTLRYYTLQEDAPINVDNKITNSVTYVNFSVDVLFNNRLGIGVGRRFNHSQSFALNLNIHRMLKIGYIYELGVGKGINKLDSQGFRLSWAFLDINKPRKKEKLRSKPILSSR